MTCYRRKSTIWKTYLVQKNTRNTWRSYLRAKWVKHMYVCGVWRHLRVYRRDKSSMVQQMLVLGKALKGKIPHAWQFWNIRISKPPYNSSLKIFGSLHFSKFLVNQEKIQSTVINDLSPCICQPVSNHCICQSRVSPARELSNVSWPWSNHHIRK